MQFSNFRNVSSVSSSVSNSVSNSVSDSDSIYMRSVVYDSDLDLYNSVYVSDSDSSSNSSSDDGESTMDFFRNYGYIYTTIDMCSDDGSIDEDHRQEPEIERFIDYFSIIDLHDLFRLEQLYEGRDEYFRRLFFETFAIRIDYDRFEEYRNTVQGIYQGKIQYYEYVRSKYNIDYETPEDEIFLNRGEVAYNRMSRYIDRRGGWIRDLTIEGIEPNPGPAFMKHYMLQVKDILNTITLFNQRHGEVINIVEALLILVYDFKRCNNNADIVVTVINFFKHTTKGCLLASPGVLTSVSFVQGIIDTYVQSDDDNYMSMLSELLTKYERFRESKTYKKIYRFIMYMLATSVFRNFGLTMDNCNFTKLEQEAMKKKYYFGTDFIHCILDTITFLYTRGVQCIKIGSMDPIYHDEGTYGTWADKVYKLKIQSQSLSNPEAAGFTFYDYLAELRDVVDQGRCIVRSIKYGDKSVKTYIAKLSSEVEILLCNAISKREAQKSRDAPFSVLLYGCSSIAKSTLTQLLFSYFGKLYNLPVDDDYIYTRNSADEYWVNFNTTQWCVLMDDIAYLCPSKAQGVDKTLNEIIQVVNSTAFVPTQAALEDKGKTPMRAKLVIATTNTMNINAEQYFSCPLAVQRRLPFVIEVKPKQEYLLNKTMIDGNKLPETDGENYPDYWDFFVYKVVPHELNLPGKTEYSKHVLIEAFTDINDFLCWFGKTSASFMNIQNKEIKCKKDIRSINVCKKCFKSTNKCDCALIQSREVLSYEEKYWSDWIVIPILWCYFNIPYIGYLVIHMIIGYILSTKYSQSSRVMVFYCKNVGYKQRIFFGGISQVNINKIMVGAAALITVSCIYKFLTKDPEKKGKRKSCKNVSEFKDDYFFFEKIEDERTLKEIEDDRIRKQGNEILAYKRIQGNEFSYGIAPEKDENEIVNVWYKDDFKVTDLDISRVSLSMKGLPHNQIFDMIYENCAHFISYSEILKKKLVTKGFCVGGQYYVLNNHGLPSYPDLKMKIILNENRDGVREQYDIMITPSMVRRFIGEDLCVVWLPQVRPRKNLRQLLCLDSLRGGHSGFLLTRNALGEKTKREAYNIQLENVSLSELELNKEMWSYWPSENPTLGDCGSVLLSMGNAGPIILGIHVALKSDGKCLALRVSNQFINKALSLFDVPMIQSGNINYSSVSSPQNLVDVNKKSEVRFIDDGNALVYGSFLGHRSKPKSNVGLSPICNILSDRGYKIEHGPPVMKGWEPWRNNLLPSLDPKLQINTDIMLECAKSFADDLIQGLGLQKLKKMIEYDDFTVINGAAGVRFVDKMNRNTSAGFPFNKSKKHFIHDIPPQHDLQDPVEFNDEIKERIQKCIDCYNNNTQYHPIYNASLKDEPRSFKKIKEKNTRVFTGGPVEHIFVTRKELLSYTKIIQENKYISECAAGTIAQSCEWDNLYKYLTQFGKDRVFDGDYTKFDKGMESTMIIMVFYVITRVLKASGADEQYINRCWCIGYDLAFAVINYNGTLLQMCKGHVSGEALTVLVNSHCNSLYIRYAYLINHPNKTCRDFKKNIALMTYGDDFVGNVNKNCSFNFRLLKKGLGDINIKVTPADKLAEDYDLMNIDQINFLKRTFRYEPELDKFVCPLDISSIRKSLMVIVKSKTISDHEQIVACIGSAIREYFWYGKERFEKEVSFLRNIVSMVPELQYYVMDCTFPTWDQLMESYKDISSKIPKFVVNNQ